MPKEEPAPTAITAAEAAVPQGASSPPPTPTTPGRNDDAIMLPIAEHTRGDKATLPPDVAKALKLAFTKEGSFASFTDNVFVMALLMLLVLRYVRQGDVPPDLNIGDPAKVMKQLGVKDMMESTVVEKLQQELEAANLTMPTWMYERMRRIRSKSA